MVCGLVPWSQPAYQVYAINPRAVSRYRDRHSLGGAKSDRGDAEVLADLVRTDRHNHRPVAGDSPESEGIKIVARTHQNLIWARVRHTNQLRNALREYYPAVLETFLRPGPSRHPGRPGSGTHANPGCSPNVAPDPCSAQSGRTATQPRSGRRPHTEGPQKCPPCRTRAG